MLVFIAYSNKDQPLVEDLIIELGVLDYNVQFEDKVPGGSLRWQQIFENIARADIFIFTVTANTLASHSRWAEYNYASALGKPILAVRLEAVDPSNLLPENTRIVDYSARDQALRSEFAEELSTLPISAARESSTAPADVSFLISDLHERIGADHKTAAEKIAILLNLQELLERRETFVAAESLFDQFAPYVEPKDEIAREFKATRKRIQRINSSPRRRRLALLTSIILLLLIAVAFVGFFRSRMTVTSTSSATPLEQIVELVATETSTSESLEASTTVPVVEVVTATTVFTASSTPLPSATAAFTASPKNLTSATLTFTPSTTSLPSATATFTASETTVPSATPTFTPSSTLLPSATPTFTPSSTPLPSATLTFTPSSTPLPSATATSTSSPTPHPSATPTFTASPTLLPSATPTRTPTVDLRAVVPSTMYVGIAVEDTAQGVRVTKVGTSAAAAGVQVGDSVLAVDLTDVSDSAAFYREMNTRNAFARVNLRLRRNGGTVFAIITLGIEDYTASP